MQKQPKREDFIEPKKKAFYSFAFFNDFSNRVVGDFLYVVERAWTEQKMGLIFMLRGDTLYRFAYYSILTFFKVFQT